MPRNRGWLCLTAILLTLITTSSAALASATQNGAAITAPTDDVRQVVTYATSLEAEAESLRTALAEERQAIQEMLYKQEAYIKAATAERELLEEQNGILAQQVDALKRQCARQKKMTILTGISALILGGIVGYAVGN